MYSKPTYMAHHPMQEPMMPYSTPSKINGASTYHLVARSAGPLMISGVVLHSLPAGYRFDLRRRVRVVTPILHAIEGGEIASS